MSLVLISRRQRGFALMECLFAILIFAVGILALLSLQATSISESASAKYRTDASLLANQLIGEMWTANRTTAALGAQFGSAGAGPGYTAWRDQVYTALPGASDSPPTVTVAADAALNGSRVTIQIFWKAPSEPAAAAAHNYTVITQIM